jgi:hypothetical protein
MGAFVAADVTITKVKKQRVGLMKESLYLVAFGDASKTVPTNGIPLPALGRFGLKRVDFHQLAPVTVNGYAYRYDEAHHSIRLFQVPGFTPAGSVAAPAFTGSAPAAHTHDLRVIGGITEDEPVGLLASGPTLGKLAATNRLIAGADEATKGGVVGTVAPTPAGTNSAPAFTGTAVAAAAMSEVPITHAPAATVLRLMLRGK